MFQNSFSTCAFFFSMWRSAHTHINLRQLWPSVPWWVACELISWLVPTLCQDNGIVSPLQLQWVKSVCVFRCNLPPALLAEWLGSFTCHCSITVVEWTLHKSQHAKLTLKKKILPPLLLGFEPTTFRSRVQRSSQQATQLPHACSHVYTHTHTGSPQKPCTKILTLFHSEKASSLNAFGSV